jgi:glucan-binding YG repeat protein
MTGANWDCFNENGKMITGQYYYDNVWYNFNQDGTMVNLFICCVKKYYFVAHITKEKAT